MLNIQPNVKHPLHIEPQELWDQWNMSSMRNHYRLNIDYDERDNLYYEIIPIAEYSGDVLRIAAALVAGCFILYVALGWWLL